MAGFDFLGALSRDAVNKRFKDAWTSISEAFSRIETLSTSKEDKIPQLTTTERNALVPVEGDRIYNLTTHTIDYWNGTVWKSLATL